MFGIKFTPFMATVFVVILTSLMALVIAYTGA